MSLDDVSMTEKAKIDSYEFRWKEPFLYRLRLHRDLPRRLVLTLGACLTGTGLALIAATAFDSPDNLRYILGAGAGFGAVYALNVWFHTPTFNAGTVTAYDRKITYRRNGFEWIWAVTRNGDWPLESISQAVHVPAAASKHTFDVLLLKINNSWTMLGVSPDRLEGLLGYLYEREIEVEPGTSIPQGSTEPIPWRRAAISVTGGLVVLTAGWLIHG
ncbi:MAG TPA: hypothetical protein VLA12_03375 [Planctomycetaceae bacterium]|nr:hypothetical protein [Planctomycetaceae bacterium]